MPDYSRALYHLLSRGIELHMWQLRIPFPDAPELWKDWNWVYNKPEALANIDYKMRQWDKSEGGKRFKAHFGDRYTMKVILPDVGG